MPGRPTQTGPAMQVQVQCGGVVEGGAWGGGGERGWG